MPKAISIHIGADYPGAACPCAPESLGTCEGAAQKMADLAVRKNFEAVRLIGPEATPDHVQKEIEKATRRLASESIPLLLITFSGHGCQVEDLNGDEALDESWCLYEGILVDDRLLELWHQFPTGARIVLISDSCYSGGIAKDAALEGRLAQYRALAAEEVVSRMDREQQNACHPDHRRAGEFQASLLLLASVREEQPSSEGYFMQTLLTVVEKWDAAGIEGTYCQLWTAIGDIVGPRIGKKPYFRMLGTDRPGFAFEPAFKP